MSEHSVDEVILARMELELRAEKAEELAENLSPRNRSLTIPFKTDVIRNINEHISSHGTYLTARGTELSLLVPLTNDIAHNQRRMNLQKEAWAILDGIGAFCLEICGHYEGRREERLKLPTHVLADEIDLVCNKSVEYRTGAWSFFNDEWFFFNNLWMATAEVC